MISFNHWRIIRNKQKELRLTEPVRKLSKKQWKEKLKDKEIKIDRKNKRKINKGRENNKERKIEGNN